MIKLSAENGWVTNDQYGVRMPWYTSGMLDVLDKMDLKDKRVFEYGVGYSTFWYISRGCVRAGVDSSEYWASITQSKFDSDKKYYTEKASYYNELDIIIIDGIYRDECTEYALKALKSGGMLIIDNWQQPSVEPNDWTNTLELTKGMKSEVFAQEGHEDWKTIYFIKP